jgi:nitrate/nitrite transporter NarK
MPVSDSVFLTEFRRNWRVLLVAFVCLLIAFSAPAFALPFMFGPIIDDLGWTREQATLLASAKYLTGSVVAVIIGRFIDVIGVRNVLLGVSVIGGIALVSFLWVTSLTHYYLAGAMLGIAGPGTIVAIKVLISRNFHASQGTAMGIALLGPSVGAMIVPFAITYLIGAYGWRAATALMSSGIWLVALPMMIFLLTDKSFEGTGPQDGTNPHKPSVLTWKIVRDFIRLGRFWLISAAVFAAAFVDQAMIQHQVLYLEFDLGLAPGYVAAGISAMAFVALLGRPLVGAFYDRLSIKGVSLTYLALSAACLLALAAVNPFVFGAYVVFRAIAHSSVLLDTVILAKHTFGLTHIGILLGAFTAFVNLGFALGNWFMGYMFDTTGSYVVPFVVCAVIGLFAALVLLPVRPDYWLGMRNPGRATPESRPN